MQASPQTWDTGTASSVAGGSSAGWRLGTAHTLEEGEGWAWEKASCTKEGLGKAPLALPEEGY